jgi:hypothetical protein
MALNGAAMDHDAFWAIIDRSRAQAARRERPRTSDFIEAHIATLGEELRALPTAEIVSFYNHYNDCRDAAYRWDLWGAAYWLHGGCGNDGFLDFRSTLVSLGRANFERVLKEPDFLAEIAGKPNRPYLLAEGFQYVAGDVYRERTGASLYDVPEVRDRPYKKAPDGEPFDCDDREEMARRFPRIVARFPDMGE